MLKPSADLIIDPKQSRYSLVVGVAKRARQIVEEAEKNGQILVEKPVDLAVHDFMDHKYRLIECPIENDDEPEEDEMPVAADSAEEASADQAPSTEEETPAESEQE